jgi:hypothetical protein
MGHDEEKDDCVEQNYIEGAPESVKKADKMRELVTLQ